MRLFLIRQIRPTDINAKLWKNKGMKWEYSCLIPVMLSIASEPQSPRMMDKRMLSKVWRSFEETSRSLKSLLASYATTSNTLSVTLDWAKKTNVIHTYWMDTQFVINTQDGIYRFCYKCVCDTVYITFSIHLACRLNFSDSCAKRNVQFHIYSIL